MNEENMEDKIKEIGEVELPGDPEAVEESPVNWEGEGQPEDQGEDAEAGVQVGITPFGIAIQVTSPGGDTAQKTISPDEAHLLAGQLQSFAAFVINLSLQAQMMERQRIEQMMQQAPGEERTSSGLYVKR